MLEQAGLRRPAAAAVVDGRHRLTYADLVDQATRLGHAFARLGVGKGDRVLIVLKNRLEHVLAYWALQMIGGVPTPAGFRLAAREVRYILDDCGASVVLFEAATADAVQEAVAGHQARLVFVGDDGPAGSLPFDELLASGAAGAAPDRELAEGDLSLILYTSGTTGRPKGVPRTHRNHVAGALAHVIQCGYGWLERTLGVMPLYHTMGIHSLTSMAAVNGCFVCQPDWSPAGALARVEAERISALYLIPTLYYDLVHAPELRRTDVSSVGKLGYAGAPMSTALTNACARAFQPRVFVNHYGSTEIYTFSVRADVHAKPGCAGRPGRNGALRVVAASTDRRVGPDEIVPAGEKGEIIASLASEEAFAGYWN